MGSHEREPAMRLAILLTAVLLVSSSLVAGPAGKTRLPTKGTFTSAQASAGATVYSQSCALCHGGNLQGESGPALTGQIFRQAYGAGTAAQLYDFISRQMPQDKPCSLSPQQYLNVTSYILGRNGMQAGTEALRIATLSHLLLAEVKHDVWDYDAVSNVVLFDVHRNGETIPAAAEAGKVGWVFIVDRRTGRLIRKSDPYVMMSKNMFSTPTREGVDMLPGANGGAEWSPPAYSPRTGYLYILAMNQLMHFTTKPAASGPGLIRLGSAFTNVAQDGIQNGPFVALDVETGKIAWQYIAPQPLIGGALATAGNLVFMGEGNGWFDAFNATTGELLWRYNLGAGVNAPPVSYQVNGEQYVAVAAGGNFQLSYPYGDTVSIFKLSSVPAADSSARDSRATLSAARTLPGSNGKVGVSPPHDRVPQ
jgi:mono/diheme cytochrome c family protein